VLKEDLMVGARFATLSSVVSATVARVASFRTRSWPALTTLVSAPELVFATLSSAASAIVELPASSPMVLLAEEEDLVADLALVLLVAPSCALPSSVASVIVATPASSAMVMLEDLIFPLSALVEEEASLASALLSRRASAIVAPLADSVTVMPAVLVDLAV